VIYHKFSKNALLFRNSLLVTIFMLRKGKHTLCIPENNIPKHSSLHEEKCRVSVCSIRNVITGQIITFYCRIKSAISPILLALLASVTKAIHSAARY
jgi:hypothetical protein